MVGSDFEVAATVTATATVRAGHADQVMDAAIVYVVRTGRSDDLVAVLQVYAAERDNDGDSPREVSDLEPLSHKRHAADGAHRLYTSLGFEPEAEGFRLYLREVPAAVQAARVTQR